MRGLLPLAVASAFVGCDRKEPRVYLAPKELPPKEVHTPDDGHDHGPAPTASQDDELPPLPKLVWTLPEGWKELGSDELNFARFSAAGEVSINVTPLRSLEGKEPFLINMWRDAVQMEPLDEAAAKKELQDLPIAGTTGKVFDLTGERTDASGNKSKSRIYTALLHRAGRSWFFKLQGPPEAVEAQVAVLKSFLATLKFEDVATPAAPAPAKPAPAMPVDKAPEKAAPPTVAVAPANPTAAVQVPGKMPEGWASLAPGPMQAAKFSVPEKDGSKAEVSVSIFPSDTGGAVANVRRWRGQVGMAEADDAAIQATLKPLEGGPEGAIFVELEHEGRALTGAIVPRGGSWYFYKLMGGTPAVVAAKEAFILFARAQ